MRLFYFVKEQNTLGVFGNKASNVTFGTVFVHLVATGKLQVCLLVGVLAHVKSSKWKFQRLGNLLGKECFTCSWRACKKECCLGLVAMFLCCGSQFRLEVTRRKGADCVVLAVDRLAKNFANGVGAFYDVGNHTSWLCACCWWRSGNCWHRWLACRLGHCFGSGQNACNDGFAIYWSVASCVRLSGLFANIQRVGNGFGGLCQNFLTNVSNRQNVACGFVHFELGDDFCIEVVIQKTTAVRSCVTKQIVVRCDKIRCVGGNHLVDLLQLFGGLGNVALRQNVLECLLTDGKRL